MNDRNSSVSALVCATCCKLSQLVQTFYIINLKSIQRNKISVS